MRVLITGASGGIGAACVQRFLDEGHEVVGFDLLPAAIEHERYRHLIGRCPRAGLVSRRA